MHDLPRPPRLDADPAAAIIAACKQAKTRLAAAPDAMALALAVAELVVTMSLLEESLVEWAMTADASVADEARDAIAQAARRH